MGEKITQDKLVDDSAHLMTDKSKSHMTVGKKFAYHSSVNHSAREYARGDTHSNTAESFAALLEWAKLGVFHHMSEKHLFRYLNEVSFRWAHRVAKKPVTKKGKRKIKCTPMPFLTMATSQLSNAFGRRMIKKIVCWRLVRVRKP